MEPKPCSSEHTDTGTEGHSRMCSMPLHKCQKLAHFGQPATGQQEFKPNQNNTNQNKMPTENRIKNFPGAWNKLAQGGPVVW